LAGGNPQKALEHFQAGWHFPRTLGGGRWSAVSDLPCQYYEGVALAQLGQSETAEAAFKRVLAADESEWSLNFLPSLIYFKALALQRLGKTAEAEEKLEGFLAAIGIELDNPEVAEPINSQPFHVDAQKLKQVHLTYLLGLAHHGLGHAAEAQQAFEAVLALDPYHPLVK